MDFNKPINDDKGNQNAGPGPGPGPLVASIEATDEMNNVQAPLPPPPQTETNMPASNGLLTNGSS